MGSAAFSTAIQCYDFVSNETVCLKVIKNNKDFFDQSLDEIKLLSVVKNAAKDNLDKYNLLRIHGLSTKLFQAAYTHFIYLTYAFTISTYRLFLL